MTTSSTTHPQSHDKGTNLSLLLEGFGEAADVLREVALVAEELDVGTIDHDAALLAHGNVLVAAKGSEAPILGDDDLLATRELRDLSISCIDSELGGCSIPCTGNA
jgi:hypothetical protein